MSDEIDDLSFPNAVITRLMNEAVISLSKLTLSQYLILVRRINNDLQRSSISYVTCSIDIHTLYQHNVCFRYHFNSQTLVFSLVQINMLRMQSVRLWLFRISSKPCKQINLICLLNLYKKH
jgi:hypothetical protein